jgi:hypothetical protein
VRPIVLGPVAVKERNHCPASQTAPFSGAETRIFGPHCWRSDCGAVQPFVGMTGRMPRVWTPPGMQAIFLHWQQEMRSSSYVCPASICDLRRRGPLWIVRRSGPNRNAAVKAARGITGSPDLVFLDFSPITSAQNRRIPRSATAVRRRAEPGRLHPSSSRPRPCGPSCSPAPRRPASWVFAPACAPARNPPARRRAAWPPG